MNFAYVITPSNLFVLLKTTVYSVHTYFTDNNVFKIIFN